MASFEWPPQGAGGGVSVYATLAAFPATSFVGDLGVAANTGILYEWNGSAWVAIGGPGAVLSVGALDSQSPSTNGAVIAANALVLQSASDTEPGLVNTATQTLKGNKTVDGTLAASNLSGTNTGDVTLAAVGSAPNGNGASLSGQALTLQPADGSNPGLLTALAQSIGGIKNFNSNIFAANLSGTNSGDVTLGTANGLSLSGQILSLGLSSASTTGSLSSTDWNTFNNKQSTLTLGNLTDAGTDGIVVTNGSGSVIGSGTSLAQHVSDTTHNGYLSSTDWNTFNGKQAAGNYVTALTGDVTASGPGSVAATIAANAVTNAKLAQMAAHTYKGNNTASTANAVDLTATQLTAELNVFSSSLKGLAPSSGGGTANFLRADGTFAAPTITLLAPTQQVFTASGTYTRPTPAPLYVKITVIGSGAGGGGGNSAVGGGGGGGGSGGGALLYASSATIGTSQTVTIGAAGAGGAATTNGTSGSSCSFGALVSATGGSFGGLSNAASNTGNGGVAGTGTGGTINVTGGAGGNGIGGVAAVLNGAGGVGGSSPFGLGGGGAPANSSGQNAGMGGYGSGGGGGASGGSQSGANGVTGIVIVEEFYQ